MPVRLVRASWFAWNVCVLRSNGRPRVMARGTGHSARDARTPTPGQTRQAPLLLRALCTPGVPWAVRVCLPLMARTTASVQHTVCFLSTRRADILGT